MELFGNFATRAATPPPVTAEPPQSGERRIVLHGHDDSRPFKIGYRAPAVKHPDFAAFLVLQELLGGGSGVSFLQNDWGTPVRVGSLLAGATDNLTTWFPPSAGDYIFIVGGTARDGVSESVTENIVEQRVKKSRERPVHQSTLDAAIARTLDEIVFDVGTTEDAAHQLAYFAGLNALDTLLTLGDRVAAVTVADVQRVARTWLLPGRRTIAWYLPGKAKPPASPNSQATGEFRPAVNSVAADLEPAAVAQVHILDSGIPVIIKSSNLSSSVQVQIVIPGNAVGTRGIVSDLPIRSYSSLLFHRRPAEIDEIIATASAIIDNARIDDVANIPDAKDPQGRLGQVFDLNMKTPGTTQYVGTAPALVVVAGDVEPIDVLPRLNAAFGSLEPGTMDVKRAVQIENAEIAISIGAPVAQAQLGYIVSVPGPMEPSYEAVRILLYILSHGYEGRLGKEAISRRGLAYYIESRYRSDGVNGWVTLGIGVDPARIEPLKTLLLEELLRLETDPPTEMEIDEAKRYLRGRAQSAYQSNGELAASLAQQWLWHGDARILDSLDKRLAAVARKDVLNAVPGFINGLTIVVAE